MDSASSPPPPRAPRRLIVETYGVRIEFGADRSEDLQSMLSALPPSWEPRSGEPSASFTLAAMDDGRTELRRDGVRVVAAVAVEALLELIERDVRAIVAARSPRFVFVHAAAAEYAGAGIVIPGRSYAGKSTLVAALVRAGARYYSDEFAVLDADGLLHPFAKSLSLRLPGTPDQPVAELGGTAGLEPVRVGAVISTSYQPDGSWEPRALTPGQGVSMLLAHTFGSPTKLPAPLPVLRQAVSGALVLEGDRGEAEIVAPQLLALLRSRLSDLSE